MLCMTAMYVLGLPESTDGLGPLGASVLGTSVQCPNQAPPANSGLTTTHFIGVPGVAERDAVPDHRRTTEQTRPLHCVFSISVADEIHGCFETLAFGSCSFRKQVQLAGITFNQPSEANT
jgi:hypothetical protein